MKPIDGDELYERIYNFYHKDRHLHEIYEKTFHTVYSYDATYIEHILYGIKESKQLDIEIEGD